MVDEDDEQSRMFLFACPEYPTPDEAWENSEGECLCQYHYETYDNMREEFWLIVAPPRLHATVEKWGRCLGCHDQYVSGLIEDHYAESRARVEQFMADRGRNRHF